MSCFSRQAGRRSSFTPYSMARGNREAGAADETHNEPLQRTRLRRPLSAGVEANGTEGGRHDG